MKRIAFVLFFWIHSSKSFFHPVPARIQVSPPKKDDIFHQIYRFDGLTDGDSNAITYQSTTTPKPIYEPWVPLRVQNPITKNGFLTTLESQVSGTTEKSAFLPKDTRVKVSPFIPNDYWTNYNKRKTEKKSVSHQFFQLGSSQSWIFNDFPSVVQSTRTSLPRGKSN